MRKLVVVWSLLVGFSVVGTSVAGGTATAADGTVSVRPTRIVDVGRGLPIDSPAASPTAPTASASSTTQPSASSSSTSSTTTPTNVPVSPTSRESFQQSFTLPPMGDGQFIEELYETSNAGPSRLEPVGLYLDKGDVVFIKVSGGIHVWAHVGMVTDLDYKVQRTELGNGLNQLIATHEGPLLLANESTELTATATVYAPPEIKRIPTFRLGEATDAEVNAEVRAATDVPKFFLVGKYFMSYVNRDAYLATNFETGTTPIVASPMGWLAKRDRDVRLYHEYVGRIESLNNANANSYPTSREFVTTQLGGYMGAGSGYVGIAHDSKKAMVRLFDMDEVPYRTGGPLSWGPWHELGHHQQQLMYSFPQSSEANANIYSAMLSMKAGHGYGLNVGNDILPADAFSGRKAPADATGLLHPPMFRVFMQLYAAFGEGFYTRIHHLYRILDHRTKANTTPDEKFALFVYMSSKASGYDLRPFFASWRFPLTDEYDQKVEDLDLPEPSTDLAARTLVDIKTQADLEAGYEEKLEPYTNLPYADAKSSFMYRNGMTLSPYRLIDYDPAVVAKAEYLNPDENPFAVGISGRPYGKTMVEILLTGHDGQQNVIVVTGMIKPKEWGRYSLHSTTYRQVYRYVHSADFEAGNIDVGEANKHLEMIHGTNYRNTAPLIEALRHAIDAAATQAHGDRLHEAYFDSLSDADTMLYNGRPALRVDADQWQSMIEAGHFVVRAYDTDTRYPYRSRGDRYLGQIRDERITPAGNSLDRLKYDRVGSDVVLYVDLPFGADISGPGDTGRKLDEVTFDVFHKDPTGTWQRHYITLDPNRIGATDQISGHWVDAQFRPDMTYLSGGDRDGTVIFALPKHSWDVINANGTLSLDFYRNGVRVGSTVGPAAEGVWIEPIEDRVVTLRLSQPGLRGTDFFEIKGTYASNASADLNGRIYLKVTANMLDPTLPIRLS